jgi:hypothetical protein
MPSGARAPKSRQVGPGRGCFRRDELRRRSRPITTRKPSGTWLRCGGTGSGRSGVFAAVGGTQLTARWADRSAPAAGSRSSAVCAAGRAQGLSGARIPHLRDLFGYAREHGVIVRRVDDASALAAARFTRTWPCPARDREGGHRGPDPAVPDCRIEARLSPRVRPGPPPPSPRTASTRAARAGARARRRSVMCLRAQTSSEGRCCGGAARGSGAPRPAARPGARARWRGKNSGRNTIDGRSERIPHPRAAKSTRRAPGGAASDSSPPPCRSPGPAREADRPSSPARTGDPAARGAMSSARPRASQKTPRKRSNRSRLSSSRPIATRRRTPSSSALRQRSPSTSMST